MHEPSFIQRLMREKTLARYLAALERGDVDTLIAILQQSAEDAVLEQMIFEVHETYTTEEELLAMMQEEGEMEFKEGIHKSLPGGGLSQPEPEPVPVRKHRKYTRLFQVLAAVLVVCILGGGIVVIQILRTPRAAVVSSRHGWCQVPVLGLNTNIGAPILSGIAAASANDIWMVGSLAGQSASEPGQTLIEHWDGAHLSVMPSPNAGQNGDSLLAVAEVSPHDVWAVGTASLPSGSVNAPRGLLVGQHTLIEHWDGQQWGIVPSPDGTRGADAVNDLQSVAAISANDVWAVGYTGQSTNQGYNIKDESALVEHWDGHTWSIVQFPASLHATQLTTITALAGGGLWAYGYSSSENNGPVLARWTGQQWSSIQGLGADSYLWSINARTANNIWVTGAEVSSQGSQISMFIAHWNGTSWQRKNTLTAPLIPAGQLSQRYTLVQGTPAVIATSFNDAWAVGSNEVGSGSNVIPLVSIKHWNGAGWQKVMLPQKYNGSLSVLAVIGGKIWTAGTIYTGLQQIPSQLVETSC